MNALPIDPVDLVRVAACLDSDEVYKQLSELINRLVKHDWMRICVLPPNEDELRERFTLCDGERVFDLNVRLPLRRSLPGEAILTGRPIVRKDLLRERTYTDEGVLASEVGLRSLLVLPFAVRGQPVGTLELGSREPGRIRVEDLDPILDIATFCAIIVEHAWRLEEDKELTKIRERRRLAWDIHDTVVQSLVNIILQLEVAEQCLRRDVPAASCEIKRTAEYARAGLQEARGLVLNLRPPSLEHLSLHEALERELATLRAGGIDAHFSMEGSPRVLPTEVEVTLYRVGQEALVNIRKHARARGVSATLKYGPDVVLLSISDDGVGFDPTLVSEGSGPDGAGSDRHFGLRGGHERALHIGGNLWVESAPGHGTKVVVEIPTTPARPVEPLAPSGMPTTEDSTHAPRIRVLLVDDHTLFREGLRRVFEQFPEIEVVGEAADAGEAMGKARDLQPDVALVDVQMPGTGGIELVAALSRQSLATRVLVLSAHREEGLVAQAVKAGARGYLLKDIAGPALAEAVRAVHRGEMFFHPAFGSSLVPGISAANGSRGADALTRREGDVLGLIAAGLRNKEIARKLHLTEGTVKFYVAHILAKLGASSRTEALIRAQKAGLLDLEPVVNGHFEATAS